jgi:hypothetical protein
MGMVCVGLGVHLGLAWVAFGVGYFSLRGILCWVVNGNIAYKRLLRS